MRPAFADLLAGGDRRSIGRTNQVVRAVERDPRHFEELWRCLSHADPLVRMRAADALEKVTRDDHAPLQRHKTALLGEALDDGTAEVRWHLLVMATRLALRAPEASRLMTRLLFRFNHDRSRIVRVMALQSAFDLAQHHAVVRSDMRRMLDRASTSGAASLRARARLLMKRLERR